MVGTVMTLNEAVLTPMATGLSARFAYNHNNEQREVDGGGWDSHSQIWKRGICECVKRWTVVFGLLWKMATMIWC